MAEHWVNVDVGQVLAQTNNGQGDCLFVSLAEQLNHQYQSLQLRNMAVQHLSLNRQAFEAEILSLGWDMQESNEIPAFLHGAGLIEAVLQCLSLPYTWAGAECISALSQSLQREIRVYQENGPLLVFPRGAGAQSEAALRILLRFPEGGNRRTHYESVLEWRAGVPSSHVATSSVSVAAQTDGPIIEVPQEQEAAASTSQQLVANSPACPSVTNSGMVLRPRPSVPSHNTFRREDFSDEEVFNAPTFLPSEHQYRQCLICRMRVGRYVLLNCGAFPVCGGCIRMWFVRFQDVPCPHCGRPVAGWSKVFNQH